MRQKLVAGNWKMNGSKASIKELLDGIKKGIGDVADSEVAVCPPAIYLGEVESQLSGTPIAWGAQNLSTEASGAFTGETAASMVNDFNCKYVLVGHSERRTLYGEDDAIVAKKFAVARAAGLKPVLCIGETLDERESGVTEEVCARQIQAVIDLEGVAALADGVIAYEPVWAIGTGKTASPEQAQEVHGLIRNFLKEVYGDAIAERTRLLYGGSVKPSNSRELLSKEDIDGALVGGASLKPDQFAAIIRSAH